MVKFSGLVFLLISGCFNLASAKDLASRLGVGYSDQFSTELPSMVLRYYPNSDVGLSGHLGIDTQKDASKFGAMVKFYRIIYPEENMNFYMGSGAGIISKEKSDGKNQSGFELIGFAGVEFFWMGLENLGINMELGFGVASVSSETRFRTLADHPFKAGMTFYF